MHAFHHDFQLMTNSSKDKLPDNHYAWVHVSESNMNLSADLHGGRAYTVNNKSYAREKFHGLMGFAIIVGKLSQFCFYL